MRAIPDEIAAAPRPSSDGPGGATLTRKAMWLILAGLLLALPFLSLPGLYVSDTRDALWLDPTGYLSRTFLLWRSSPFLGHEARDGLAFPMGAAAWLFRTAGAPAWVAERLWHGLLLLAGTAGTIVLVDELTRRREMLAQVVAGLAYSLTPFTFGYGLPTSGAYVAYALLPALLLVTLRGLRRGGIAWPALFGLVVFSMGGGNGAPQVYAVSTAFLLMAWVGVVDRGVPLRRVLAFAVPALVFTLGLNAWWVFLLTTSEVSNALDFSEQPSVINVSSSVSEAVRGLGFWQFYSGDRLGAWVPVARPYVTNPLLIVTGFALPTAALVSAWLVRWRHRLFFLFLAILSTFVVAGIFPVDSPTPFGRLLLVAYDRVPGAAGLRTTYKLGAALNLSVAVLVGVGLAAALERIRAASRSRMLGLRAAAVGGALILVAANAHPLWTGGMYNAARSTEGIPRYWDRAVEALSERNTEHRAYFFPALSSAVYRWGALKEGIAWSSPDLSAVQPIRLPVGTRYGSNLLAAIEHGYAAGIPQDGIAQVFRYLGVKDVVLQNDIDWERSNSARPAQMQGLTGDPQLRPFATFGLPGPAAPEEGTVRDEATRLEGTLSPVEVLTVEDPTSMIRAEAASPVVLSGDGFGIVAAARRGLLDGGPPVVYSATLGPEQLEWLFDDRGASFVVTDTNRRRAWSFSRTLENASYTLSPGQTLGDRPIGYGLFDGREGAETVALYPGLGRITASGYGNRLRDLPQFRPANAFDGDPDTWWLVGALDDPVGHWVQATFEEPRTLSEVAITVPPLGFARQIRLVRLEFSDGTSVTAETPKGASTVVEFEPRRTRFLRVRILALEAGISPEETAVGIADVQIPGLTAREVIRVPTDLLEVARQTEAGLAGFRGVPFTYLFERARTGDPRDRDEEVGISRRFEVPVVGVYELTGEVRLDPRATDEEIDDLVLGPDRPVRVTASSRAFGIPRARGGAAFDGDPETGWVSNGAVGEWLRIEFERRTVGGLTIHTQLGRDRSPIVVVEVTFSDGSTEVGRLETLQDGTIEMEFAPRGTDEITIEVTSVGPARDPTPPVGIDEVEIPGVDPLPVPDAAILACTDGPGFTLDGLAVSVRGRGTVGDLLDGEALPLATCRGNGLTLSASRHELVSAGPLQADAIVLTTGPREDATDATGRSGSPGPPSAPAVRWSSTSEGGYEAQVTGALGPHYLVIGQSFAPGWRASVEGQDLGPPVLVDGYSAAWRITRRGSYTVRIAYGPQRAYAFALVVSGLFLLAIFAAPLAVWAVRRRRR
ncbi:MAG: DUF3367 domain-containing protein [Actinobacteria bacterium]|nr:DUF3367 domain-containing protein [Actinomycetota bacterium]